MRQVKNLEQKKRDEAKTYDIKYRCKRKVDNKKFENNINMRRCIYECRKEKYGVKTL